METNDELSAAIARLAQITGQEVPRVVNRMARLVISFSINKVPKASAPLIIQELEQKIRTGRKTSRSVLANKWSGSLAAGILIKRFRKNGRLKGMTTTQFYREVDRFVRKRAATAGYHRAGWYPALAAAKGRQRPSDMGKWKNPPGSSTEATEGDPTAIAVNFARAIAAIAPDCVDIAMQEALPLINEYCEQAIIDAAAGAGFRVSR